MEMQWTDRFSVGNAILDSDHKDLFRLAMNIDCAIMEMDHSALAQSFKQLRACMNRHFLNEELFAHALNIPFAGHQYGHQNMLAEIDLTSREIAKDSLANIYTIEHYAQFLQDWLIKHITEEDMGMKPALQTRPYDYRAVGVFADD